MALFGRRRKTAAQEGTATAESAAPDQIEGAAAGSADTAAESTGERAADSPDEASAPATDPSRGPWDAADADADDRPGRVDLGALRVPGRNGMALRMELDRATKRVIAANVTLGQSNLHLQAFAAPRTAGIWDDIRAQIATSIKAQGGDVREGRGPFGPELLAMLPVRDAAGKVGRRPARFLGVDGPRWFLRGVLTGAALVDQEQKNTMEQYFSEIVVVRGNDPRPPSELLTLTMPGRPAAPEVPTAPEAENLLRRGPEISEVR